MGLAVPWQQLTSSWFENNQESWKTMQIFKSTLKTNTSKIMAVWHMKSAVSTVIFFTGSQIHKNTVANF